MKCQILFSGKNKKNIINLSSAENAQRVVKVNVALSCLFHTTKLARRMDFIYSRLSLSRLRFSRITVYLEVKIWPQL